MQRRPKDLENGNASLAGYIVRNVDTGNVIDDGFGHVKIYANVKAARRKASQYNSAPVPRITAWQVFPCNVIIGQRPARRYQN